MKLFFLFFLLVPMASAFNCSETVHQDWCLDIQNSDLSEGDKSYLLDDIFNNPQEDADTPEVLPEETDPIIVETDKVIYDKGETVRLNIRPTGEEYTVRYAGNEYRTSGVLEFPAQLGNSEIVVNSLHSRVKKYIYVKNQEPLNSAFWLGIFGVGNYAMVGLIRKYWGFLT